MKKSTIPYLAVCVRPELPGRKPVALEHDPVGPDRSSFTGS